MSSGDLVLGCFPAAKSTSSRTTGLSGPGKPAAQPDRWADVGGRGVDVNPDSPWNPRVPVDISPGDFEKLVLEWLRRSAEHQRQTITTEHLGVAPSLPI